MKRKVTLLLFTVAYIVHAAAQTQGIEYGPWISSIDENGCTILWTSELESLSWVELAPATGEDQQYRKYFEVVSGRRLTTSFHAVRIDGLEPGESYRYRICGRNLIDTSNPYVLEYDDTAVWSQEFVFKTNDTKSDRCSFSMVNDMHFMAEKYHKLTCSLKKENTDFLFLNGDISSFAHSVDTVLKYNIGPVEPICGEIPLFFIRGNHETKGRDSYRMKDVFPSSTGELYYSFRHGPVFFVVLDNGGKTPDSDPGYSGDAEYDRYREIQTQWLREVIASEEFRSAPVQIVLLHMPPIGPDAGAYVQKWMTAEWVPILSEAGVDLMLCGHQHRHNLFAPGSFGNSFPICVNSNVERMDVEVRGNSFSISVYDTEGALTHRY